MSAVSDQPIAELGYESDTGPRVIPTRHNFVGDGTPVKQVFEIAGRTRALNREGRAICRIAFARGWTPQKLAKIFALSLGSISRAIANKMYSGPRDNIAEDYSRLDQDLREFFLAPPPLSSAEAPKRPVGSRARATSEDEPEEYQIAEFRSNGRPSRAAKIQFYNRLQANPEGSSDRPEDDAEPLQPQQKRSREDSPTFVDSRSPSPAVQPPPNGTAPKRPRLIQDAVNDLPPSNRFIFASVLPARQPSSTSPASTSAPVGPAASQATEGSVTLPRRSFIRTPSAMFLFLRSITTKDLSIHFPLLVAQGFSMQRLHILGSWDRATITYALNCLLRVGGVALGGHTGMLAVEAVILEQEIIKLGKARSPICSSPHRHSAPQPSDAPHRHQRPAPRPHLIQATAPRRSRPFCSAQWVPTSLRTKRCLRRRALTSYCCARRRHGSARTCRRSSVARWSATWWLARKA
ncbi:hypothetical protein B0H15DRAFT_841996 [Mycena belliarum]|uniref:Uncharacterized protein n=1 Tax=Mycena belliarum TaxID=1033014 RepID=A0AAD6U819_9AGAR|nr:hypothetical protein B0H15DRAFT_841996 [Mycena belliae]